MNSDPTSNAAGATHHRIPLLKDRHTHPLFYAACMDGLDIRNVASKQEAIDAIEARAAKDEQEILIVRGWVDSKYTFTADDLADFRPTIVFNLSLHGLLLNTAAASLLKNRYGSLVDKWRDRHWYERNIRVVLNCVAKLNASVERLKRFYSWLREAHGVAYAEEMLLVDEDELYLFDEAGLLDRTQFWAAPDTYHDLTAPAREMVHGLKLFSDGALGVRTAAVHSPYDTGTSGFLTYTDGELVAELERCFATGKAIAVHAIGDRAIEQVVASFHKLRPRVRSAPEVRIEHAQLISKPSAQRAKDLGIKLCMQPNFSADSEDYSDRLAKHYLAANNPFRMLIDEVGYEPGRDLIFGSDGMPHGAAEALKQSLFPPHPAEQRLKLDEFVAGYCLPDKSEGHLDVAITHEGVRVAFSTNSPCDEGTKKFAHVR